MREAYAESDGQVRDDLRGHDPISSSVRVSAPGASVDVDDDSTTGAYGLPGAQHELRFEVAAGRMQCMFQYLRSRAQLHLTFQVYFLPILGIISSALMRM
jgi:hypothetical protein